MNSFNAITRMGIGATRGLQRATSSRHSLCPSSLGPRPASRHGFTLIEMLVVVVIIMILMSIAVVSMQGFVRGAGLRGAVANVRGTLSLARQFAVTHRGRTYVLFSQDATNAHYIVCVQDGQHIGADSEVLLVDGPRWEADELVGATAYNLSTGQRGVVTENAQNQLKAPGVTWHTGDLCGWAVRDQQHLARGLAYGDTPNTPADPGETPEPVVFKADGSTPLTASGFFEIPIKEVRGAGKVTIKVSGLTGMISVEE